MLFPFFLGGGGSQNFIQRPPFKKISFLIAVPSKDMQTHHPLEISSIFMKDVHNAESNEKSIFRFLKFLFFELWLSVFTIYGDTPSV